MEVTRFISSKLDRRGNFIALFSVALSIAVMVVAICVTTGFKGRIRALTTGFSGSIVLAPPGEGPLNENHPFTEKFSYRGELEGLRFVESLSPTAFRSGVVKAGNAIHGLYFKGVDSLYDFSFYSDALVDGALPSLGGRISSDVLISDELSALLGIKTGDRLQAFFVGDDVKARNFTVCGVFDARLEDLGRQFVLVDIRQVRRLAGWEEGESSAVEIRIKPSKSIESARDAVENIAMASTSEGDPPLFALSVKQLYSNLFDWLRLLDFNVLLILLLMSLVAGFNMLSALLIILLRQTSSIGVLKSLGMTDRDVTRTYLRLSSSLVLKGLAAGNLFGLGLALLQYFTRIMRLDPESYFVSYVPIGFNIPVLILVNVGAYAVIMLLLSLTSRFISRIEPSKSIKMG